MKASYGWEMLGIVVSIVSIVYIYIYIYVGIHRLYVGICWFLNRLSMYSYISAIPLSYLVGDLEHVFISPCIGTNHPNLIFIFFKGFETTNQIEIYEHGFNNMIRWNHCYRLKTIYNLMKTMYDVMKTNEA